MDFGVALATPADAWKATQRAEELQYQSAWFYDTQVLSADLSRRWPPRRSRPNESGSTVEC